MIYKNIIEEIAKEAGVIIKNNLSIGMDKKYKEDNSPVTITDTKINSLIIDKITKIYPEHSIRGEEESSMVDGSDYVWICDPVDGTIPFSAGMPICTFSLALVYKGNPIAGCIYEPFMDRMLLAQEGKGAFLNGEKVSVNNRNKIDNKSLIALENFLTAKYNFGGVYQVLTEEKNIKMFQLCSVLYAGMMLCLGEFDGVLFPSTTVHDGAALKIIVEESGGKMTDVYGNEQDYDKEMNGYIASNGKIHNELVELVSKNIEVR